MATAGEAVRPLIRPHKIVERPRLMRLLEGSKARILLLTASAGYGKTTLAEQWAARGERRAMWIRCRRSSSDIAVISRQIASAGAAVIDGCDRRFGQRLSVTPDPASEADVLAEILAEDLAAWPSDAWIVIDDYHYVAEAAAAERFVEVLVRESPIQLLIASRSRPAWASSRHRVYAELRELDQTHLAMNSSEVELMLPDAAARNGSLVRVACGWPAVIGLAASSPTFTDHDRLPVTLLEFFRDEVYASLSPHTQVALALFSVLPQVDHQLWRAVLGVELAATTHDEVTRLGLLEETEGGQFVLHPLVRVFMEHKLKINGPQIIGPSLIERLVAHFQATGNWDAILDLTESLGVQIDHEPLVSSALVDLLREARLATLERWLTLFGAKASRVDGVQLARAELAIRKGQHLQALTLAESAIRLCRGNSELEYKALLVAGQAAHIGTDEKRALSYFRRAQVTACSDEEVREALWGQLMCLSELESRSAATVLEELASTVRPDDARQLVREVGRRIGLEFRTGRFLSLQRGAEAAQLLELVQDPVVRVSFRSTYATALALAARYGESQDVAQALLTDAEEFRLDFARPYGLATLAIAQAGSRDFARAVHSISEARAFAQSIGNTHAEFNAYAIAVRILVQQGRHEEALRLKQPIGHPPGKGITGEVAATSALVKACLGRTAEAQSLLSAIRGLTQSVEATVLTPCVDAIIALINRESDAGNRSEEAFYEACRSGALDLLISSYRASSVFFATLLANDTINDQFASVLSLASDESLAQALSPRPVHENEYRTDRLSRRERQVYDLVCQGLTNRQIAGVLFISEQTVKLHVHHIFDKLGTRSRTALVLAAARSQAAPRTDVIDLPSEPG